MDECGCGRKLVATLGKSTAPILILGESPDYEDLRGNRPFVGEAGQVLRAELTRAGIQLDHCRFAHLWRHDPKVDKEHKQSCYDQMMTLYYKELEKTQGMLLLGAETCKILVGKPVSSVMGCNVVTQIAMIPAQLQVVVAAYSPGVALSMSVGDFRLSIERFAKYTKEIRKAYANRA